MTHHTDPFEYSEYKRSDHQEDLWDKVVTIGAILTFAGSLAGGLLGLFLQ
jgi:hypothetical protein